LIYIIAGVSGVGKTTIGKALAQSLEIPFLDADDFHPSINLDKMSKGIALTDEDRRPWLESLNTILREHTTSVVLACSALKEKYRTSLTRKLSESIQWIFLTTDIATLTNRMASRDHFMPVSLLQSQLDTLELPDYGQFIEASLDKKTIISTIINDEMKAELGLIGLGVMGKSLARNFARNKIKINVFNRHVDGSEVDVAINFVASHPEMAQSTGFDKLDTFVESLARPRKIMLMVNAGSAVDQLIGQLTPLLDEGDILIDGGNSHYKDTQRRYEQLQTESIHYIGTGVSGGEQGALLGPSIMPGGSVEAYQKVGPLLEKIAAKDKEDQACCDYIGKGGSGHFVKMVHNGIEYGEMQIIAEVYGILRYAAGYNLQQIADLFSSWNSTDLGSYLLEITSKILTHTEGEGYLIDLILDRAGNKGTGSWTTIAACELGVPIPTLTAALFARYQSAFKEQRLATAQNYPSEIQTLISIDEESLKLAYQQARIINHHQGFDLCIIRSQFMEKVSTHINASESIIDNEKLAAPLNDNGAALMGLVSEIANTSISHPCLSSAMDYLKAYVQPDSLANIIQAQRDYFGAHTYERKDKEPGQKFHTQWP